MVKERLRTYRLMRGMNQKDFAKELGYCETQYVKVELGHVEPSLRFMVRLQMFGGMSESEARKLVES